MPLCEMCDKEMSQEDYDYWSKKDWKISSSSFFAISCPKCLEEW
jgi:hypothetical protein